MRGCKNNTEKSQVPTTQLLPMIPSYIIEHINTIGKLAVIFMVRENKHQKASTEKKNASTVCLVFRVWVQIYLFT